MTLKLTDIINSDIGTVPIGGIIPIAAHMTGAFTVPTTDTEIRSGWMLCAGGLIPAGNALSGNTPVINDARFIMGDITDNSGVVKNGNTVNLEHGHSVTSNVTVSTQPAFNSRSHYHGRGTLAIGGGSHTHSVKLNWNSAEVSLNSARGNSGTDNNFMSTSGTGAHTHTTSGSIGATASGNNGDSNLSCIRATDVALANNSVNSGNALSTAQDVRPQYISCVYIIRVK